MRAHARRLLASLDSERATLAFCAVVVLAVVAFFVYVCCWF